MKSKSKIVLTPKHSSYDDKNVNSSVDSPILNESPEWRDEPSTESLSFPVFVTCESEEQDLTTKLKAFRVRNINRIIITHINLNSIRNKIDLLAEGVRENIDILMASEIKIDDTFPTSQLIISGFTTLFRFDRTDNGVGKIVYIREDILSKELKRSYIYDRPH